MVDTKKYHVIDLETGHLDRRIFADPDIYQEELEKILRPCLADDWSREPYPQAE